MSQIDSEAQSRQTNESETLDVACELTPVSWLSALRGFSLPKIALLVVGVVAAAVLVATRAGWMPGLNAGVQQRGLGQQGNAEAISTGESPAMGDDALKASVKAPRPTPTPIVHVVSAGESLLEIAANYGVSADLIARANDLWDPNRLKIGQTLVIPSPGYVVAASETEELGEMRFWWPLQGEITTYFGEKEGYYIGGAHTGIDIAANIGAPVRAAAAGKVVVALKQADNLGWHIVLDHGDGWSTVYGHLSRFAVDEGDSVERGQVIGSVGDTGFSFGPHLHFEVRRWGTPVDPLKYLP